MIHKLSEKQSNDFGQLQRWVLQTEHDKKKMLENESIIDVEVSHTIFVNSSVKGNKLFTLQVYYKLYETKDKMPPEFILQ